MNYNFKETAKNGNIELLRIFRILNQKSKYKINIQLKDNDVFSYFDAIAKIDNKFYLVEHKNRDFDDDFLKNNYSGNLLLEDKKLKRLEEIKKTDERIHGILYINTLSDGIVYIFDLNKTEKIEDYKYMAKQSCGNTDKTCKKFYYLNIKDALKIN